MRTVMMSTSELMKGLSKETTTVFTTWKTHEDFLPVKADKESLLENLEHQLQVNGEQTFGVMVKEQTKTYFEVEWVEGVELFLL